MRMDIAPPTRPVAQAMRGQFIVGAHRHSPVHTMSTMRIGISR